MMRAPSSDATFGELLPQNPEGTEAVVSVSNFTQRIRRLLEETIPSVWVEGEISGFNAYASGHWYFKLKDEAAQISCVMFKGKNQRLGWQPREGMAVELRGVTTFYAQGGTCQITVEHLREAGVGKLFEAFARLKARLESEGLFDEARKRPLPAHPRGIGLITSLAAAALRDVLTTLKRRSPATPIIIYPTLVQGEGAAVQIARAITVAGLRAECDVLILCRGGGSIEDLWSFNEEVVAQAIAACPIPIIAGIGHERDFTIADFVADQRAATPTAAAELVSPNREELLQHLNALARRLNSYWLRRSEQEYQRLDVARQQLNFAIRTTLDRQRARLGLMGQRLIHPGERLSIQSNALSAFRQRMTRAGAALIERRGLTLQRLQAGLLHLNPEAVLARGFSIVRNSAGVIVRDSGDVTVGEAVGLTFATGHAAAQITKRSSDQ
jgi:exodeoxyribonuclease VII large subunit